MCDVVLVIQIIFRRTDLANKNIFGINSYIKIE